MSMQRQMMLLIGGPVLLIYVLFLGLAGAQLVRSAQESAEVSTGRMAARYAAAFEGRLVELARIAETTSRFVEVAPTVSDDAIYAQLSANVLQTPLVFGSAMAFEPGVRRPPDELFAPYVFRDGDVLQSMNIGRDVYDWYADPSITWFSRPRNLGRSVWSDPYFDEGAGNILMSTYSAVISSPDGFMGVCTIDIDLTHLRNAVGQGIGGDVDFVVLTRDGRFVFDPDSSRIMRQTIFDVAAERQRPELAALAETMLMGGSGVATLPGWDTDEDLLVCYEPIPSADWVFVSRIPVRTVLADVRTKAAWAAVALAATLLLMLGSVALVSRTITRPIARLREKVSEVGRGNLDVTLDESVSTDEIRELAATFNRMTGSLRAHVDRLSVEISARSRIERDLDVAREIQQGLLPSSRPNVAGYEIAGYSQPADKTGGDYYDWCNTPDGRLFISLADVTGHGVGPALVTAVCRAYVHASLATGQQLPELLSRLNDLLVADLPAGRFVTFAGFVLDANSHTVETLSAGHGPSFHYIAAERRLVEYGADGFPLGIEPGAAYSEPSRFTMQPGDLLVVLTDGLFECPNNAGERFGLERLRAAILDAPGLDAVDIIKQLTRVSIEFASETPPEDDVTLVVVKRRAANHETA
jgi:sigma-B regulation protein RsbU (phosphoserine phosphatase)